MIASIGDMENTKSSDCIGEAHRNCDYRQQKAELPWKLSGRAYGGVKPARTGIYGVADDDDDEDDDDDDRKMESGVVLQLQRCRSNLSPHQRTFQIHRPFEDAPSHGDVGRHRRSAGVKDRRGTGKQMWMKHGSKVEESHFGWIERDGQQLMTGADNASHRRQQEVMRIYASLFTNTGSRKQQKFANYTYYKHTALLLNQYLTKLGEIVMANFTKHRLYINVKRKFY